LENDWKSGRTFQENPNPGKVSLNNIVQIYMEVFMKKSSLFISAVLTTFVLAVLAGVFTTYRALASNSNPAPTLAATATQFVDARQAAEIAAKFLNEKDLYSVTSSSLNGTSAYKVTFSSGVVAYVSPTGQVVSIVAAPPKTVITTAPVPQPVAPSSVPSFSGETESGDHE
jgi:hypothetical protein